MTRLRSLSALARALIAGGALAASHGAQGAAPSTAACQAANATMHEAMMIEFTGDAAADFARGKSPHHQGAIAMAKVVPEHGADPDLRRRAEEINAAQKAEIDSLMGWLNARGL